MIEPAVPHPLDLTGRTALVTGGTRGIGAAVSLELARAGARVVLGYRADDVSAERTRAAIAAAGGSATTVKANLVRPEEVRQLVAAAGGSLDILVHSAAIGSFKPVLDVKPNQWDLTVSVNARAFLLCVQEAAPLLESGGGSVVAVSSLGSSRVVPAYGAIGASKAALESLVRSLAVELAQRHVRVNGVSAGLVDTLSVRLHPGWEELAASSVARTPTGRLGTPEDVARVVLFLVSPLAAWITGQTLVADGGLSLVF